MKFLCLIISCYVLLLSANPCCAAYDCVEKVTIKKEVSRQAPLQQKECPGCSPFFSCGSCIGFIITERVARILPAITATKNEHFNSYLQPEPQETLISIWQPPKLS